MKKVFYSGIILALILINRVSGLDYSITTLQHGVRNVGLGYSGVSFPAGIDSIFYNPALLPLNEESQFMFESFFNPAFPFDYFSTGYLHKGSGILSGGFNFVYYKPQGVMIMDEENRIFGKFSSLYHILNAGSGLKINDRFSAGINFKFVNSSLGPDTYNTFNIDTGLAVTPVKNLNLGLNIMNLFASEIKLVYMKIKEPLNIRPGISYIIPLKNHEFLFSADFNTKKIYQSLFSFGFEYTLFNIFSVQLGYDKRFKFTGGSGIKYHSYAVNYSFQKISAGITHRAGISYYFPPNLADKSKEILYNRGIICYNNSDFLQSTEIFNKLYREDNQYRETAHYYELSKKKLNELEEATSEKLHKAGEFYQQSLEFFNAQKYTSAVDKLIECLKNNPRHGDARQLLSDIRKIQIMESNKEKAKAREKEGDDYFSSSQYPPAMVEYREALKLNPENRVINKKIEKTTEMLNTLDTKTMAVDLYNEGKLFFNQGHYNKAISRWQEALAANPEFTRVNTNIENANRLIIESEENHVMDKIVRDEINDLFIIADDRVKNNLYAEALFKTEEILELDPGSQKASVLKNNIILKINTEKINNNAQNKLLEKKHLTQALTAYKEGKLDTALEHFSRVIALNPEAGRSVKELNRILMQMSSFESAGMTEDSPNYKLIKIHYERGMNFFNDNNYTLAAAEWKRVLNIVPNNSIAKIKAKQADEGIQLQEPKAQEKRPGTLSSNSLNTNVHEAAVQNRPEQPAMETDPSSSEKKEIIELYNHGVSCFIEKKYNECINTMKSVLALYPDNDQAMKFIEKAKDEMGKEIKKTVNEPRKNIDKKAVYRYYLKGINYYTTGDIDNAINEWKQGLKLDPGNSKLKTSLNKAYAKKEMLDK